MNRKRLTIIAAIAAFLFGFLLTLRSAPAQERFDYRVRNDFFAGFAGNKEALDRGMNACEEILKSDPKHAEAMVWHGAGLYYQGGQLFQRGEGQKGQELVMKGIAQMDAAVALEPGNVGVRVPRGAVLLQSTLFINNEQFARPLIEKGLSDYAKVAEVQAEHLDKLGTHPRGELLFGIADAHRRLGDETAARAAFERVAASLPGTVYEKRAKAYLETGKLAPAQVLCAGCHTLGK